MEPKIFLGGTCNNSTWRDQLISMIEVNYFNPVVEDWTEECQKVEIEEKECRCNIHLYVITSRMKGVFSIAEVIDSAHEKAIDTIFFVIPEGFDEAELKSLNAVVDMVKRHGEYAFVSNKISKLASLINGLYT